MQHAVKPAGLQDSYRTGTLAEMATLKAELLADNIKPTAIKLYTKDPGFKDLLMCVHHHNAIQHDATVIVKSKWAQPARDSAGSLSDYHLRQKC